MDAALALGRRGLGRTSPNPSVGSLVVKHGIVVGRGVTALGGRPHGEPLALAQAGAAAQGATIYVTLEPCSHHGVTPPCCEAIVAAGIRRLIYALDDPNPDVAGRGAAYCRARGLDVVGGVRAAAAKRDHLGHVLRMLERRPAVTLKLAETADGFVAGGPYDARLAITGAPANGMVHAMRATHDAIMVGVGTALADDPLMTVRLPGLAVAPLRVILDARLQLPRHSRLARTVGEAPILVLTSAQSPRAGALDGVDVASVPLTSSGRVDLRAALNILAERGITRVFSEGGPSVGSALVVEGLADEVILLRAPKPLGHPGVPTLSAEARDRIADPLHYRCVEDYMIGVDRLQRFEKVTSCSPG